MPHNLAKALKYMPLDMLRQSRILGILLIIWVSRLPTHGVEIKLPGLNIEQIVSPNAICSNVAIPENATHLDDMLRYYPFPASIIDDQVAANLTEQTAQLSDTDESIEDGKIAVKIPTSILCLFLV